jgi:hypothetical protein
LRELLAEALEADEAVRRRLLAAVTEEDPRLGADLADLVRADAAPSILDRGFDGVARALVATAESGEGPASPEEGSVPWAARPARPAILRRRAVLATAAAIGLAAAIALGLARLRSGGADSAARTESGAAAKGAPAEPAARSGALREAGRRAAAGGAAEGGLAALAEAAALDEAAYRAAPGSMAARARYAESLLWLGAQRTAAGRAAEALEPLGRAEALLGDGGGPGEPRLRALVALESSLAELDLGRLDAALGQQRKAVDLLRALAPAGENALEKVLALRDLGDLQRRLAARRETSPAERNQRREEARAAYLEAELAARAAAPASAAGAPSEEARAARRSIAERLEAVERELGGGDA